jgi:2-dehydro-3-deoxy-L-rhamnonate dehydrogenase (NAD+)
MKPYLDQIAIITGAASGLGFAIATKLAQQGVKLALMDINAGKLQTAAAALPPQTQVYPLDITDERQVQLAIEKVGKHFGTIDILVNSAGITGETNIKSHHTDTEDIRKVFDVNYFGSYFTAKYALPYMLQQQYGRVLHIASIAGKEGNAGMMAYSASKAAVIAMAKVQGKEYADTGITINALAPAVIRTPMVAAMPEEQVKYMTDKIPLKRCGTLEEVANLVSYIVSPQNSFTTAFTFDLSGGRATY